MNSILYCFEFPVHFYPTHFYVNPITTSEFAKLYNDIKHEWFSQGPGGHIKGKNDQSEGGSSPEEGGGETIVMVFTSVFSVSLYILSKSHLFSVCF